MKKKILASLIVLASLATLAACDTVVLGGGAAMLRYFERPDVNLVEKNYAAADYLMQAGANFASKQDDIKAAPLRNVAEPALSTNIGRVIAKQTGDRLMQLGYRVDLTDVALPAETDLPYANPAQERQPDFVLSGVYFRAKTKVDVRLRLVDARSGRVVASFDYPLPMSHEVQNLSTPKAQIYRTTPQGGQQSAPRN